MRKGDERKLEILSVAERLFCSRGFAETSVQDILDTIQVSKGGFYHHFESKEAVLDTICMRKAERTASETVQALSCLQGDAMGRINLVFRQIMPLREDELPFMRMLLPLLDKPESIAMRVRYQEALHHAFMPILEEELHLASEQGVICPPVREVAEPVLLLLNQCWLDAALALLYAKQKAQPCDTTALFALLERYRRCIEVLLDAPYGSVLLLDLSEWIAAAEAII